MLLYGGVLAAPLVAMALGVPAIVALEFLPMFEARFPLSGVQLLKLHVEINPAIAVCPGQRIFIMVTDEQTSLPVEMARIEVSWDSQQSPVIYTDVQGRTEFDCPGETTVVAVYKTGYNTEIHVIPQLPMKWIIAGLFAYLGTPSVTTIVGTLVYRWRSRRTRPKPVYG